VDDHPPGRFLAGALGPYAGVIGQGQVDGPALVGVHRVERVPLASPLDAIGEAEGQLSDLLLAAGPVPLDVEDDPAS
jgi:hypothetical protein